LRGGSARSTRGTKDLARTGAGVDRTIAIEKVEIAPTVAVQELKQAATVLTPSGQQGQGLESSAAGIELAQGISDVAAAWAAAIAVAAGANESA
jgi:hypothetical protein